MSSTRDMAAPDATWLHVDRSDNPMVINCIVWSAQPMDWERVCDTLKQRWVERFPGFRQLVAEPSSAWSGRPRWKDSQDFRFEDHVHHVSLPPPGEPDALQRYVGEQASRGLDRSRPLWEVHCIDGYQGGSALLLRIHHAIGDGHVLVRLFLELDERSEVGSIPVALSATPRRGVELAGDVLTETFQRGVNSLLDPAKAIRRAIDTAGIGIVAIDTQAASQVLRAPLSGRKALRWLKPLPLSDVKAGCRAKGVTLNDVFMAALAGGLRTYLPKTTAPLPDVRVLVPVDLRAPEEPVPVELGNRFGLLFVSLPVSRPTSQERLDEMKRRMSAGKSSHEPEITFDAIRFAGQTPEFIGFNIMDTFARGCSGIVSNVPGPRSSVVLGGTTLTGLVFYVPTSGLLGLGMCVGSYDGRVTAGVSVDQAVVPDVDRLVEAIDAELAELLQ